jgi:uncharacterized membrane protein
MRCVGYSKRTSDLCFKEPVPNKVQNDRIREFAKANGMKVLKFYEDRGNDPDGDRGFQKMREDGMRREFDFVIIDSAYRCGKNVAFARNLLLDTFYLLGIHFAVLEDGVNSMEMTKEEVQKYFEDVRFSAAGCYGNASKSKNLTKNGRIDHMKERYGYVLNEEATEMLIDEEAAAVVRKVFDLADSGVIQAEIVRRMNEEGVESPAWHLYRVGTKKPLPRFHGWTKCTVHRITHCRFYVGMEDAQMGGVVYYPRIIEPEQFERVEARVIGRTKGTTLGKRISNLFKDRIYYGSGSEKLYCKAKVTNGESKVIFHRFHRKAPVITYDAVLEQVMPVLRAERETAREALRMLDGPWKEVITQRMRDERRERAESLFNEALKGQEENLEAYGRLRRGEISGEEYEKARGEIMTRQAAASNEFGELIGDLYERESLCGERNPWIARFLAHDLDGEPKKRAIFELTKRILVQPGGKVRVELNEGGKEIFPDDFLREASENAKEKQKN